jgi:hypothetical protein
VKGWLIRRLKGIRWGREEQGRVERSEDFGRRHF